MKKIISFVILAALCLSITSCSKDASVPEGMQDASGDGVAYSLYIPTSWSRTTDVDGGFYSQNDKSSITVTSYYPDADTISIEAFWNKCKEGYSETYKNFQIVEEAKELILGGKKAFSFVFSGELAGRNLKYRQIIAAHGDKFYTLTYTSTPENFDLHEAELQSVIDNFKFK